MHGYNYEHNVDASDVAHTWKSVHGIDYSMLKLFEFANLSFFLPCPCMILFFILIYYDFTSCEGHKLWKLSIVHWCHQSVTIENYFSPAHTDYYDLRK